MMKKCKRLLNASDNEAGFTLVELAIVMIISGLFLATAAKMYSNYNKQYRYESTISNLEINQRAIDEYFTRFGRYPCPADPSLPRNDPMYGVAWCTDLAPALPHAGVSLNIVYTNVGSRDANFDGTPDTVAIGIVPFKTLDDDTVSTPYSIGEGFDAYGHAISYAVSDEMTRNTNSYGNPVKPTLGAINVRDANNNSVVTPDSSVHYVIYSHGETSEGSYNKDGVRIGNCFVPGFSVIPSAGYNPGTPGINVELENCDNNDAIFVKELRSFANDDNFNDDTLYFGMNLQSEIWRVSAFSPPNDTYYFNTNLGSVSAGELNPTSLLYISGSIRAESQIMTDVGFCPLTYTSAGECLDPNFLGGTGDMCPPGEVATGIENNSLVCRPLLTAPPNFISYCSAGEFMRGFTIDALGNATADCDDPTP